jgi:hypothetical protein
LCQRNIDNAIGIISKNVISLSKDQYFPIQQEAASKPIYVYNATSFDFLINSLIVSSGILTDMDSVSIVDPTYSILVRGSYVFSSVIGTFVNIIHVSYFKTRQIKVSMIAGLTQYIIFLF